MKHGFRHRAWQVWAMPVALALSSAAGMVLGLLGSGLWRWLAGALMAWPVVVGLWYLRR
jgi:hypothetical protein